ncbi:hypothetical protein BGZ93_007097 [Podila epicladia]|nr:hypothetical protein BGZ92_003018 [Podila epicladia]KAG0094529.1 hypothetical protein BGZ93_007097 [Podila epicladia]
MPPKRAGSRILTNKISAGVGTKKRKIIKTKGRKSVPGCSDSSASDSEKDIETVKDYEDAVQKRILTSTTNRYEDLLEQDHLALAASFMMPPFSQLDLSHTASSSENRVFSLGTFCLFTIVKNFHHLAADSQITGQRQRQQRRFRRQIQQLPFYLSHRLFKYFKHVRPELLSSRVWTTLFFPAKARDEDDRDLDNTTTELDLEGIIASQVTDSVIRSHIIHNLNLGPQLERINLNHLNGISDKAVAQLVGSCSRLSRLSLKGCTNVGDLTLANLPGETLQELNISFVSGPTSKGIQQFIRTCRDLVVLKMAGLTNLRDTLLLDMSSELNQHRSGSEEDTRTPLHQLQNLKVSSTKLGDRGLKVLLGFCGKTLRRLDISGTNVTRTVNISQYCVWEDEKSEARGDEPPVLRTMLEKVNLTRLKLATPQDLVAFFKGLPPQCLHTLLMGYLTVGQVPLRDELVHSLCPFLDPASAPSMDDDSDVHHSDKSFGDAPNPFSPEAFMPVRPISNHRRYRHLHTLSFFGNPQIGQSRRADHGLRLLFKQVAPTLRRLELGYTRITSDVLTNLLPFESLILHEVDDVIAEDEKNVNMVLEELGLDETPLGSEAWAVLAQFRQLNRLSLANTRMEQEAVERVVQACKLITSLDLTSCRAIPIRKRRSLLQDVRKGQTFVDRDDD